MNGLKKFPSQIGILHGELNPDEKNEILEKFLQKKANISIYNSN